MLCLLVHQFWQLRRHMQNTYQKMQTDVSQHGLHEDAVREDIASVG